MEPIEINVTDLRLRTREIMERVKYGGERFLIRTFGHATAVIISLDEYEEMKNAQALTKYANQNHSKFAAKSKQSKNKRLPVVSERQK